MESTIETNKQYPDEKMKKVTEYPKEIITSTIISTMSQMNNSKSSPDQKYPPNTEDPTTVAPDNRRAPPLDSEHFTKTFGMWNLKYKIGSPKLQELLINTELKGDTAMDLKNFYNNIKVFINALTRLQEDFLPYYQSIKRHSDFEGYFIPDCDHPYNF